MGVLCSRVQVCGQHRDAVRARAVHAHDRAGVVAAVQPPPELGPAVRLHHVHPVPVAVRNAALSLPPPTPNTHVPPSHLSSRCCTGTTTNRCWCRRTHRKAGQCACATLCVRAKPQCCGDTYAPRSRALGDTGTRRSGTVAEPGLRRRTRTRTTATSQALATLEHAPRTGVLPCVTEGRVTRGKGTWSSWTCSCQTWTTCSTVTPASRVPIRLLFNVTAFVRTTAARDMTHDDVGRKIGNGSSSCTHTVVRDQHGHAQHGIRPS